MDEKIIKNAFEFADYMIVISNQKVILKEQLLQSLIYYEFGGTFTITKELLTFVNMLVSKGQIENVVLVDDNNIPVQIPNLSLFLDKILSQYTESVSSYYKEYRSLVSNRRVEKIIDLND